MKLQAAGTLLLEHQLAVDGLGIILGTSSFGFPWHSPAITTHSALSSVLFSSNVLLVGPLCPGRCGNAAQEN